MRSHQKQPASGVVFIHALSAVAPALSAPLATSCFARTHVPCLLPLPAAAFPPTALAKGAGVPFVGGAPLAVAAPQPPIDGFTALPGVTQYLDRLQCDGSLRSAWQKVAVGRQYMPNSVCMAAAAVLRCPDRPACGHASSSWPLEPQWLAPTPLCLQA